jgi:hypothetical protein
MTNADTLVTPTPPLGNPTPVTRPSYGICNDALPDFDEDEYYSDEDDYDIAEALEQLQDAANGK